MHVKYCEGCVLATYMLFLKHGAQDHEVNAPFCDGTRKMMLEDSAWDKGGIVGDILLCNFCALTESLLFFKKSQLREYTHQALSSLSQLQDLLWNPNMFGFANKLVF